MSMSIQTTYSAAPAIGYSGLLEGTDHDITTMKNVEVTSSMPFGIGVAFKLSSPGSDLDALLPASQSDLVAGILIHSNSYSRAWSENGDTFGQLDSTGVRTGFLLNILRKGRILVACASGCAVGDRLFVRAVSGSISTQLGSLENASDASKMIDCTKQGQWVSSAAAGGLAWLQVDFVNKP